MYLPETGTLPPLPTEEDRNVMKLKKLATLTEQATRWADEPDRLRAAFAVMGVTPLFESERDLEVAVGVLQYLNRFPRSGGIA